MPDPSAEATRNGLGRCCALPGTRWVTHEFCEMLRFSMLHAGSLALATGALISISAALAHLACVAVGPHAYRFMGAGEKMARAIEAGSIRPAVITLLIAGVLFVWGAYALSGAGIIQELPFTKHALVSICAAYLLRALAFPALRPAFPGNSDAFWLVSSSICLVAGLVHALGTFLRWQAL